MALTITDLNAAISSLSAAEAAVVADVTAAFTRLKSIDYTTQVASINAIITALNNLDTLAKSQ